MLALVAALIPAQPLQLKEKSKSIADLSVALDLSYVVQLPAARGRIVFHWDRFQQRQESLSDTESEGCWNAIFIAAGCNFTDAQISSVFDTMIDEGEVEFDFEGYQPDDEYSQKVMEAMLQFFTDSMMEPAPPADLDLEQDSGEAGIPDVELALWERIGDDYLPTGHSTATDANGDYTFGFDRDLKPGVYEVRETQPDGLFSVGATPGTVDNDPAGRIVVGDPDVLTDISIPLGGLHAVDLDFAEAKDFAKQKAKEICADPMLLSWYQGKTGESYPNLECGPDDKPAWIVYAESRGGDL